MSWWWRHGPRLVLAAACLVVTLMYCTNRDMGGDFSSPRGDGRYRPVLARGDGHMLFLMTRSLVFDQDLVFDNDLKRFGDPWDVPRTATGRKNIPHPIGPALVWAPLLVVAQGGAVVANVAGADIETHGYTAWHQRIVFVSSVAFGCLAVLLGARVFRRRVGGRWAPAWAGAAVLLGTSITYYATYMPSYGHAMDAAAAGGFLAAWALTIGDTRWRRFVWLGALLGLASLIRTQELALGIVIAIEVVALGARGTWRERGLWVARGAVALAVTLVAMIPQVIAWQVVFGTWTSLPQGENYTRPAYPMVGELLFAARNGWFSTTPLAYAGVLGLVVMAIGGARLGPRARLVAIGLLAAVVVQVYLNSIIYDWWAQASFGARRLCSMTLPLVVGLATWLHVLGRAVQRWPRVPRAAWHAAAVAVLGWFVAWNLGWVTRYTRGRAPERRAGPICCKGVAWPLAAIAQPVYDTVGNPFALPASAIFGVRHGVPVQRWDQVVGDYPFMPPMHYTVASIRGTGADFYLGGPGAEAWLVRGVGPSVNGLRFTTARRAALLIPNLLPQELELSLWLSPRPGTAAAVVVRWNGREVARQTLTTPTRVVWHVAGDVGVNDLELEAEPGTVGIGTFRYAGA